MADILKISQSVLFTEEDISKTTRFLDEAVSHEPLTHQKGKATIPGQTTDLEIATGSNFCTLILKEGNPFTVKIGDTTAPAITNVRLITIDSSATSVFVSNTDTQPIKIEYVTARWQL